uniref:Vacuolar ATP synthase subunit e 2 n=1 Tax=Caligus rogercresseyi TaxID=217165 RepID=C1BR75_CALRO|nr:Vacuolar ATP synthase subunit e 2 [Caligus rogercresseyi]
MGAHWLPVTLFTILWGVVGAVLPAFVPKGPNKSLIQVSLMITGACCWLFWLCCYMSQMNPLIGPIVKREALIAMKHFW